MIFLIGHKANWTKISYVSSISLKNYLILKSFRMRNKLLNSFDDEDEAICVAIQTHIAKKENIQGWDAVSLNLPYHDLSLGSLTSTMEEKMLCVLDFSIVTLDETTLNELVV